MKFRLFHVLLLLIALPAVAGLDNAVLTVDGQPFYPLGSWNHSYTTVEDVARLGMNTAYRTLLRTAESIEETRTFMREAAKRGIQVVVYVAYGGGEYEPWPEDLLRDAATLADEPNLLAWYLGDDIVDAHLDGLQLTAKRLEKLTPDVPRVADFIGQWSQQSRRVYRNHIDICCNYFYPILNDTYLEYLQYFEDTRQAVGDPQWTWPQGFMWHFTGEFLDCGSIGPGPLPDPEQVRLLCQASVNGGVRGLLIFSHHGLHRLPELAGETALLCRQVALVEKHLAAGKASYALTTGDPDVYATAFHCDGSTVISLGIFKSEYYRYVDEGVIDNVTVDCPWRGEGLPRAVLAEPPEAPTCPVERLDAKTVRVTVPRLELGGFVLVSADDEEVERLRTGVAAIPEQLADLMLPAAVSQTRKVGGVVWQLGFDNLNTSDATMMYAMRAGERCAAATTKGQYADAYTAWRDAMRFNRTSLCTLMAFAEGHRDIIPEEKRKYLISPYGLHNIPGLAGAPPKDSPWNMVRTWEVTGPFPLEADLEDESKTPPGFEHAYAPERAGATGPFDTLDGRVGWRRVSGEVGGRLALTDHFATSDNVVAYARCVVVAPREMDATMSFGSNDGARIWVNGDRVFSNPGPHDCLPHDDEVKVHLRQGENHLLAKVSNFGRNWKLYLSFHDPNRELQFRATSSE